LWAYDCLSCGQLSLDKVADRNSACIMTVIKFVFILHVLGLALVLYLAIQQLKIQFSS